MGGIVEVDLLLADPDELLGMPVQSRGGETVLQALSECTFGIYTWSLQNTFLGTRCYFSFPGSRGHTL